MPIKKPLKIAGLVLLVLIAAYFGFQVILTGLAKTTGDNLSIRTGAGSTGMFQTAAPSSNAGEMFKGAVALDSGSPLAPASDVAASGAAPAVDRKIVKTGNLALKVEKAETAAESIANIAKLNKGEVSDSNFYESTGGVKSGSITVRVPYNNFEAAFEAIKKVATQVVSESANAQDITQQYIDLAARLKNKQAEEVSFAALLSRTGKLDDIISVTKELARARGEIEQLQGQIRYLNVQTDLSTITANITEDIAIASARQDWRPFEVVKLSVKQLITAGQNFVDSLIAFIIMVLPLLVIYGLIIWLIYYIGKKVYGHYIKK